MKCSEVKALAQIAWLVLEQVKTTPNGNRLTCWALNVKGILFLSHWFVAGVKEWAVVVWLWENSSEHSLECNASKQPATGWTHPWHSTLGHSSDWVWFLDSITNFIWVKTNKNVSPLLQHRHKRLNVQVYPELWHYRKWFHTLWQSTEILRLLNTQFRHVVEAV